MDATVDQTNSDGDEERQEAVAQIHMAEPIIVPYLTEIALASSYPVVPLLSNYAPIANMIDEATTRASLEMPTTLN